MTPDIVDRGPAQFERSRTLEFASAAAGRSYRLRVCAPPGPPPVTGWPVLYVLDGDAYLGLAAETVRNLSTFGGEAAPALVLGVGYPGDDPDAWQLRRALEFTPGPPAPEDAPPPGGPPLAYGGLPGLLDMLEREAPAVLRTRWPVDPARTALFGHSLGGLAALHALFERPAAFAAVLAVSPSIWWAGRAVLAGEAAFAARVRSGEPVPRVFVGVGGREEEAPAHAPPGAALSVEELGARVARARMVGDARDLAARLAALDGGPGWRVEGAVAEGETHVSAPFALLPRALRLAFPVSHASGGAAA